MSSVLPNGYYYTFLFFDMVMPGIFGVMTLFNPYQAFSDPLPLGYDAAGDLLVGRESPRVALAVLLGAVMGPVWAITTGLLLPLAKNGMEDRPDLAEKVVRAHLISGAIVDPFHVMALAYYYPTNLLLSPKNWSPMVPVGFIWATGIGALKIAWCLGYGRATAGEMMTKRKVKDWAGKVGPVGGVDKAL